MDLLDRLRLDSPVAQAGMGGVAQARLAAAVARAGGLGTLGHMPPDAMRAAIAAVRDEAPGRSVAVNLLMPFVRPQNVDVYLQSRIDVAVLFFGGDADLVERLHDAGAFVIVQVGLESQARQAISWGVDGLIAQGREAGGHVRGNCAALDFLPRVLSIAAGRPVLLSGGIATAADTRTALDAGAAAVVAGTRFLLTHESSAHRAYQRRLLEATRTFETKLFGFGWPARHRVVANAATDRWCDDDGTVRRAPALLNKWSGKLAKLAPAEPDPNALLRIQRPDRPFFSPIAPLEGMPDDCVDRTALYAGDTALRIAGVVSAAEAVRELAGR